MPDARLLWVAVGGAIGSLLRYLVAQWAGSLFPGHFPVGTLTVNMMGALAIGALAGYAEVLPVPANARLFLQTGVLGGFTTFSAFGLESFSLLRTGFTGLGILNMLFSNGLGLLCVGLGFMLARSFVAR